MEEEELCFLVMVVEYLLHACHCTKHQGMVMDKTRRSQISEISAISQTDSLQSDHQKHLRCRISVHPLVEESWSARLWVRSWG